MGLNFLVFWFFLVFPWFFAVWPKPRENQKKQKVQTHGQGLGRGLAGDMGLNFLFFLFFFGFFHGFLQFGQNLEKTKKKQKKTKSSDPWARSGERLGWGHGSDFFSIVFFHGFFACFSCEDAFITVPLKKMRVSTICTPAPPMSTPSVIIWGGVFSIRGRGLQTSNHPSYQSQNAKKYLELDRRFKCIAGKIPAVLTSSCKSLGFPIASCHVLPKSLVKRKEIS